ncbi:MAG TPA: hypothetical protein VF843_03205, partial [Streptosporangiaceae bacterium]
SPVPSPPVPSPRPSPDPPAGSGSGGSGSRPPRPLHHPRPPRPGARVPDAAAAADSSRLTARFAALTGLTYDGVAIVPTARGREPMLKFTMRSLRLPGAALSVGLGGGAAGAAGTASLVTADTTMELSGNVELYTTRLTGVLNGVTVTFTATRPPGALPPNLTLTGVTAEQPYAAADLMRADGSHVSTG